MHAMIQEDLLLWAIKRANITLSTLSKKITVKEAKINKWLNGEAKPSFIQAKKLAEILKIPFGYLFLSEIPKEELPLPDLRTVRDEPTYKITPMFKELLYDLDRKQRWYRESNIENSVEAIDFIGKFSLQTSKEEIIKDMKKRLQWNKNFNKSSKETYISSISQSAENLGILVMRSSYLGGNTKQSFKVKEFRGLAISDEYAPLIFINSTDAKSAQIFTLAHELVHLWIGESAISDLQMFINFNNDIEKFCNEIAGELLVPQDEFSHFWNKNITLKENCEFLSKKYLVSSLMIFKRAYDLKFITYTEYTTLYEEELEEWKSIKKMNNRGNGDYYRSTPIRISKLFSESVISATLEGKLLYRDASKLLNMKKMSTLYNYIEKVGLA